MHTDALVGTRPAPSVSTTPCLSALFVVECDGDTPVLSIPRPEAQLVVRFGRSALRQLDVHALGAGSKVHRKLGGRGHGAVVARLHLGTAESVLGTSAAAIAERIVPLEDLWTPAEARRLTERLFETRDTTDAAALVERAIAERLAAARTRREPKHLALAAAARLSRARVGEVAAALAVSERHLRRVFHEAVGVGPKAFTRLTRFHRALRAARRDGHAGWASIATAAGYYDQAHLIAEFRAIAGAPPRAFLEELGASLSVG